METTLIFIFSAIIMGLMLKFFQDHYMPSWYFMAGSHQPYRTGNHFPPILLNYWLHFDFSDNSMLLRPHLIEQKFKDYILLLQSVPVGVAEVSFKNLMGKAEMNPSMYLFFRLMSENVLNDPDSLFSNKKLYCYMLEQVLSSSLVEDTQKQYYQSQYNLIRGYKAV
jgi:hypothetical protein